MTAQSYATTANVKTRLGISDNTDDTLLGNIVGQVNGWIEHYIGHPVGPLTGVTYTFDGYDSYDTGMGAMWGGRALYITQGIRTITTLQIANTTQDAVNNLFVTATSTDYVILPRDQDRRTGWPGSEVRFVDIPSGPVILFYPGYGNVKITGDFGFAAIPPELTSVAEIVSVRAWHARKTGQVDIIGADDTGAPLVSRYVSAQDMNTLRDFREARLGVG